MSDWRLGAHGHFVMEEADGLAVVTEVRDYVEGRVVVPRAPFEVEVTAYGRTRLVYRSTIELAFASAELQLRVARAAFAAKGPVQTPRKGVR